VPKKATSAKRQSPDAKALRQNSQNLVNSVQKNKPLYRRPAPNVGSSRSDDRTAQRAVPTNEFRHPHLIPPAHFTLREDGSIETSQTAKYTEYTKSNSPSAYSAYSAVNIPRLVFQSDSPFVRLYHGNSLELLDAIAAKYPAGRFDAIFADPPYFLPAGP